MSVENEPLTDEERLAKQLWALGDVVRLRILAHLPREADCEHKNNVSELAGLLGLSQPTISHHLRVLRQAGVVKYQKMCRDCFYWIDPEAADSVVEALRRSLGPSIDDEEER